MDADLYTQIVEDDFQSSLQFYHKPPRILFSSRIMIQSTLAKRPRSGFKPMNSTSCHGQLSPQTSIQLSIFGIISKGGLDNMKIHRRDAGALGEGGG